MATSSPINTMGGEQNEPSGTGSGFGRIVLILAGVSSLVACLLTILYVAYPCESAPKYTIHNHFGH